MIYLPVTLLLFLLFLLLFPFIWLAIALDVVEVAVGKLGFSPSFALLLFAAVILGSTINIPLYERISKVSVISHFTDLWIARFWGIPLQRMEQKTALCGLFALLLT